MANEVLMTVSKDEIERARLLSELKYELDMQSARVHAEKKGRKAGLEEGHEEGFKEGEKIGKEKGEKKGRREGEKKGEKRIIDLLKSGKSPEEIIREYEKTNQ